MSLAWSEWEKELLERERQATNKRPGMFQSWWQFVGAVASMLGWAVFIAIGWFIRSRM